MKITFIQIINRLLGLMGAYVEKTTSRALLLDLMSMFKPINTGVSLIRMGGDNDGGYLVPDDLEDIEYCFSPGVSDVSSFEEECLHCGIRSFMADYSVEKPAIELIGCEFLKKYIGPVNNEETITLDDWVNQSLKENYAGDLILQMDIEGSEYESLLTSSMSTLSKVRILIIEFHDIGALRNPRFYDAFLLTMKRINTLFDCVHVHPNNCSGISLINGIQFPNVFEATFLRKDRVGKKDGISVLPHRLDQPNMPDKDDINIQHLWQ